MKARELKNLPASVRAQLLAVARRRGEEFQLTLTHFAIERLLFRIGKSAHRDKFILKGAMLFTLGESKTTARRAMQIFSFAATRISCGWNQSSACCAL